MCVTSSHWVPGADVFAGGLDHGLAGLVERPVDPVVGSRVGRLDQSLQLQRKAKFRETVVSAARSHRVLSSVYEYSILKSWEKVEWEFQRSSSRERWQWGCGLTALWQTPSTVAPRSPRPILIRQCSVRPLRLQSGAVGLDLRPAVKHDLRTQREILHQHLPVVHHLALTLATDRTTWRARGHIWTQWNPDNVREVHTVIFDMTL